MPFRFKDMFIKTHLSGPAGDDSPPQVPPKQTMKANNDTKSLPSRAIILVMGPTGVGKSTFINLASASSLRTSDSLKSCTESVELSRPFVLDGMEIVLVDTPGFDDTEKGDSEVLSTVTDFLVTDEKRLLRGVLYLHRISDNRVSGTAIRNMRFYRELCGPDALSNSVIVTNMWGGVDPEVGNSREADLISNGHFFKLAIDQGARVMRHDNTEASAHAIVRHMLSNTPRPLRVQQELIDERKQIFQTAAGEALLQDLALLQQRHHAEMETLEREMEDAVREQDEEAQRELEAERARVREEQARLMAEKERLVQLRNAVLERAAQRQTETAAETAPASSTAVQDDNTAAEPVAEPKKQHKSWLAKLAVWLALAPKQFWMWFSALFARMQNESIGYRRSSP